MPRSTPLLFTGLALLGGCIGAPQLVGTDQVPNANVGWTELKDAKFEEESWPEVDAIMEQLLLDGPNPGCAVGLVKGSEIVYLRGYGDAVLDLAPNDGVDTSVPWTVGTTSPVGSISKPLTALALLKLVDQQLLATGDQVGDHLDATGPVGTLTLAQLLSHGGGTGGVASNVPPQFQYDVEHAMAHPRLAFQEYQATAATSPGTEQYSNLGYATLGAVIDAITTDPANALGDAAGYERYVWHEIAMWSSYSFDERNMLSPALALSWREGDTPNFAHGYDWTGGAWVLEDPWDATGTEREGVAGPPGLWTMTIGDLSRLVAALQDEQILSPGAHAQMRTPRTTIADRPYGYGLWLERAGQPVIEHGGDIGHYGAMFVSWPAQPGNGPLPGQPALGVALQCNGESNAVDLGSVADVLRGLLLTGGLQNHPPAGAPVPAPALDRGVFELQLRGASVESPSNLFLPLQTSEPILLMVADGGDGTLDLQLTLPGSSVALVDSAYRDALAVESPTFDAVLATDLGNLTLADAQLRASFTSDAQGIAAATLHATLDARQIGGADPSETWEDLCGFVASQGTRCRECDDGLAACFPVTIEGITGSRVVEGL